MRPSTATSTSTRMPLAPSAKGLEPRRRAILAEDDDALRALLATTLRREGFEVLEATNGRELGLLLHTLILAAGDPEGVDLIVTDVRMPGPDGLTQISRLREYDWTTPVVVVTAFGDRSIHDEARRLGAAAVLDKPFDLDDFRTVVRNVDTWVELHSHAPLGAAPAPAVRTIH
jgi:DNA-binding response OmpR family regulator